MMYVTIVLLLLVSVICYCITSMMKPKYYPPGPKWLPFVGSSTTLLKITGKYGSEFKAFLELSKQYSTKVLGLKISSELLVVIFGEKNVRKILNSEDFDARPHNLFIELRCFGRKNMGITFANGKLWREQRQFAMKSLKYVQFGKTIIENLIHKEVSNILKHIQNNISEPIDLVNLMGESIINVLWFYVAGNTIPVERLRHLLYLLRKRGTAFKMAGGLLKQVPLSRFIVPKLSGYSLLREINRELEEIIEEAIQLHKNKEIEFNDFMNLFLQENDSGGRPTFTEEQLKVVCIDLILGAQTTSHQLSFAFLNLLRSQDIQQKVYNEIVTVLGDRTPTWNDSESLVYTSAFICEVQRYYMTVPMLGPRRALRETSMDGYVIPKGATVLMSLGDIYYDKTLWKDPHVFRPERFIDESGKLMNSKHTYFFGLGRRRCPGESLAKSFVLITLVGILQQFNIRCTGGAVPSDVPNVGLLSTTKPFKAQFTQRINKV